MLDGQRMKDVPCRLRCVDGVNTITSMGGWVVVTTLPSPIFTIT